MVGRPFCGIARINHRGRVEKEEEKGGTKEQGLDQGLVRWANTSENIVDPEAFVQTNI